MLTEEQIDQALKTPIILYCWDEPLLITENIIIEIIENFRKLGFVEEVE